MQMISFIFMIAKNTLVCLNGLCFFGFKIDNEQNPWSFEKLLWVVVF